jgi:UDP-N-acetylglucosamine acyltransferase
VFGPRAEILGLNLIGLRRRGVERAQLHLVNNAWKYIFCGPGVLADRLAQARVEFGADAYVAEMLDFMANPSRHGLITNIARGGDGEG